MKKLIMLCGLPGSGKSTWLKKNIDKVDFVYSTDSYIENVAKSQGKTYNDVFPSFVDEATKNMNVELEKILKTESEDCLVIWDQTNLTKKSRAKKLNKFGSDWEKEAIMFIPTSTHLLKINEDRKSIGRNLPNSVLNNMMNSIELLDVTEKFDKMRFERMNQKPMVEKIKKPCFVFDIDGTLADLEHRRHFVRTKPPNWNAFNKLMGLDKPIKPVVAILMSLKETHPVFFLSGREGTEKNIEVTENFLKDLYYGKMNIKIGDNLFMRSAKDYRGDEIVKLELIQKITENYEVLGIFDDRPKVCRAWKEAGFFVFDVNQSGLEF